MAIEVVMPRLSLTMEVGTVIQWLKAPGDQVAKGEDLAEIETDKVNVTMEAPAAGYLREVLVAPGMQVPCGTSIARLTRTADEAVAPPGDDAGRALAPDGVVGGPPMPDGDAGGAPLLDAASQPGAGARSHVNASPAAKNLARELGVDLAVVTGSGPGGRIGLDDVRRAADAGTDSSVAAVAAADQVVPLNAMRAAAAQQMIAAVTVPQFTVRRHVDLAAALTYRATFVGTATQRVPGVIDLIHLAAIRALREHREVNGSYQAGSDRRGAIVLHGAVHLGVAVALPEGLIVPVIRDAQNLGLEALAAARTQLQEQARQGRLPAAALGGATFTVSNLGTMHVDDFTAIVNPPEAAILAVGRMQDSLVVRDGAIHIVPQVALTVSADHRVLDGALVARFLDSLAGHLDRLGSHA